MPTSSRDALNVVYYAVIRLSTTFFLSIRNLCVMVFPRVEVRWQLVRHMVQLLVEELLTRVEPADPMHLVIPYTQAMLQLFSCPYTLKHQS